MHHLKFSVLSGIFILTACLLFPQTVRAQEKIGNEYRVTVVPTYPLSKKVFLTTYLGYVNNTTTNISSYYIGAPFLVIYRPNKVVELMAGAFLIVNDTKGSSVNDNLELRPLAGLKLSLPNEHKLNIYNWTRYELRTFFYRNDSLNNIKNRFRNRIGIEFPISKNVWQANSWYGLADFEFFFTVEKGYIDRFRQRFGVGYVLPANFRLEFIYHIQLLRSATDENPRWTDNIFRLNLKWTIANKKHEAIEDPPDMDE